MAAFLKFHYTSFMCNPYLLAMSQCTPKGEEDLKENSFWLNGLVSMDKNELNTISASNYEDIVREMTPEKIQKFSKMIFENSKNVEVVMFPVVKE